MRYVLFLLLFPSLALADNWMRPEQLGPGFELKESCEIGGFYCQKVDGLNFQALKTEPELVDDLSKPIWEAKSNVQACAGLEDCQSKLSGLCIEPYQPIIAENLQEVYCTRILGYEKKTQLKIVEDAAKIAQLQQEAAAAQAKAALQAAAQTRIDALDVQAKLQGATTVATLRAALQEVLGDLVALRKK